MAARQDDRLTTEPSTEPSPSPLGGDDKVSRRSAAAAFVGALGAVGLAACDERQETGSDGGAVRSAALGLEPVEAVRTVSELRQLDGRAVAGPGTVRAVVGHSAPASDGTPDGGGGLFIWNGQGAEDNDGTMVRPGAIPAGAGGRWMRVFTGPIDIRWFGAIPDDPSKGSINVAAIRGAVASARYRTGGTVFFPAGTWYIDDTIVLSGQRNIALVGEGNWAVSLNQQPGSWIRATAEFSIGCPLLQMEGCTYCTVQGLGFDGAGPDTFPRAGIGIDCTSVPSRTISFGCRFENFSVIRVTEGPGQAVHVGPHEGGSWQITAAAFRNFDINGCTTAIHQEGDFTAGITYRDGAILCLRYGLVIDGGDVTTHNLVFGSNPPMIADVLVKERALACRFNDNLHQVLSGTAYEFESSSTRDAITIFQRVVVELVQGPSPAGKIIDYRQSAPVVTIGCRWASDGPPGTAQVAWMGASASRQALVQELGSQYAKGATVQIHPSQVVYLSSLVAGGIAPSNLLALAGAGLAFGPVGAEPASQAHALYVQPSGELRYRGPGADVLLAVTTPSADATALALAVNQGGTLAVQNVSLGPPDSGGSGFRALRVPNG